MSPSDRLHQACAHRDSAWTPTALAAAFVMMAYGIASAEPLRDPTAPPLMQPLSTTAPSAPARQQWTLSLIVHRASGSTALLNGVTVKVGDEIAGAHVEAIRPDEVVVIEPNDERRILTIARMSLRDAGAKPVERVDDRTRSRER